MSEMESHTDETVQRPSKKPPWLLSDLSRTLATLLQVFSRFVRAVNESIKETEPGQRAWDQWEARKIDDLYGRLQSCMNDIVREEPDGDISIFDALDLISEQSNNLREKLTAIFESMVQTISSLESTSQQLSSEETKTMKELTSDLVTNLGKLNSLKEAVGNELSRILWEEAQQAEFKDTDGIAQSVLCLDSGGVRSYSSLLILEALMDCVRKRVTQDMPSHSCASRGDDPIRPHEIFDYIFGSSSGGLIAIMLGRLKMSLKDSQDTYRKYSGETFGHPRLSYRIFGGLGPHIYRASKYSDKRITDATQNIVRDFNPSLADLKMRRERFDFSDDRCRTVVLAAYQKGNTKCSNLYTFLFRSYYTPAKSINWEELNGTMPRYSNDEILPGGKFVRQGCSDVQIWQVARAASAVPHYFAPVCINGLSFVDGGYRTSNPTTIAQAEVLALNKSSQASNNMALVSIGSGRNPSEATPSVQHMIIDPSETHYYGATYFRFEVPDLTIPFDEWQSSTIRDITSKTKEYLNREAVADKLQACADFLVIQWRSRIRRRLAERLKMQRDKYIDGPPPEAKLHLAVERGNADATRGLLGQGVDVNALNHKGETPLFLAARDGNAEMTRLLLDNGAIPDAKSKTGRTPWIVATQNKHWAIARILREYSG